MTSLGSTPLRNRAWTRAHMRWTELPSDSPLRQPGPVVRVTMDSSAIYRLGTNGHSGIAYAQPGFILLTGLMKVNSYGATRPCIQPFPDDTGFFHISVLDDPAGNAHLHIMTLLAAANRIDHLHFTKISPKQYGTRTEATARYLKLRSSQLYAFGDPVLVAAATTLGLPVVYVPPWNDADTFHNGMIDGPFHPVFDADRCIIAHHNDNRTVKFGGDVATSLENLRRQEPHDPGPIAPFFQGLIPIRKAFPAGANAGFWWSVLTARGFMPSFRMDTTLKEWGASDISYVGTSGMAKAEDQEVLRPTIYFDDSWQHVKSAIDQGFAAAQVVAPDTLDEFRTTHHVLESDLRHLGFHLTIS